MEKRYSTDLSDAEWSYLEPYLPAPKQRGRPRLHSYREILNAIFYLLKTGCQWRMLPREFPPWKTIFHYFRQWRLDGTWERINRTIRERLRVRIGRNPEPSAGIVDAQSAKTTGVGGEQRGYDGGKKVNGRKRQVLVDTEGLVVKTKVHSAKIADQDGLKLLLESAKAGQTHSKAKERYSSVRATLLHTVDPNIAREANRRFVNWRFDQGSPGMAIVGKPGPPEREDFYQDYEDDSEEQIYLWHQTPNLWREEIYDQEGELKEAEVHGGRNGPRWIYERDNPEKPNNAIYMPRIPERQDADTRFSRMFDSSAHDFSMTFWDEVAVSKTGRKANVCGRECMEVLAQTISWGYPPDVFDNYEASSEGATDHLLLVDAEIGTILRMALRLEGKEFRVAETKEITYDEQFPEDTFRLELSGVEFERHALPDYEK